MRFGHIKSSFRKSLHVVRPVTYWFLLGKGGVGKSGKTQQLRLVVYPNIYRVWTTSQVYSSPDF